MLIVKKFGGSSVADKERIFNVANRCIEDYEARNDVVVVMYAMLPRARWIGSWQPESRHLLH